MARQDVLLSLMHLYSILSIAAQSLPTFLLSKA